ncbi:hypothetical protein M5J20_09280 [Corynebacterium sp. TA-R-1]|uniref:Uncharacterized protein n=1 Tax=Corynebacterium stercoris TaxID=2943490 RepID=A0ABT1G326_9CORY|nr:hypothetical protein [Corynebacterium stercoris]MCP1388376.1 hypothetical protein [Corynebacterium stercoris]
MQSISYPAVVTFWFVTTADPAAVLESEPKADRGFGRKLLSQINPAWPITPIGEFPLNRSSKPGKSEFYIAGYPGVAVVQTFVTDSEKLTETVRYLREALPAADTYMFAEGTDSDYAGFAHYVGEDLRRSLTATRERVLEDLGLPEPFEAPYWAGEKAEQLGGITLPFEPKDLMREAQRHWVGLELDGEGPDVHVVGYAIDGRPEPKIAKPAKPQVKTVEQVAARFAEGDGAYDDYEVRTRDTEGEEFAELADASVAAARRIGRDVRRRLGRMKDALVEKIRHADR